MKALLISVLLLINYPAFTQELSGEHKAQEIVERFIAESGGRFAWSKVKDYYSIQRIERYTDPANPQLLERNMTLESVESFIKEPWKILTKTNGFNYEIISSISPSGTWKAKDGAIVNEQTYASPGINNYMLDMHSMAFFFSNAEEHGLEYTLMGTKQINGETLSCIEVTSFVGITKKFYFDEKSGFLRAVSHNQESNITWYSDYRELQSSTIGNVIIPFRTERIVNGQSAYISSISAISYNIDIPDYLFDKSILSNLTLIKKAGLNAENRKAGEE